MYKISEPLPELSVPNEKVPDKPVPDTTIPFMLPELLNKALPKSQMVDAVLAPVTSATLTKAISNSPPESQGDTLENPDTVNVCVPLEANDVTVNALKYSWVVAVNAV